MITGFEQIYEQLVAGPAVVATGTVPASYIDVSNFERFQFKINMGATDGVLDAQVVQATAAAGTGSKNITGAAITQLSATDDNKQALIEVQVSKMDINNDFRYVAITITAAGTTTLSCEFRGLNPGKAPVTQPAAFAQQVFVGG